MSTVNQAIILAAGRGNQADGIAKALIRHPRDGRTILDHATDAFAGKRVVVVVGFRAIQIMESRPDLDYVINHEWAITNNAMSLGLALSNEPTYVVSGDMFFERALVERLDDADDNLVLTHARENRTPSAVHCALDGAGRVNEMYQGSVRSAWDPEAIGLFKVSSPELLRMWRRRSIEQGNLFAGLTLPLDDGADPVVAVELGRDDFYEVNSAADYLRLLERTRQHA